MTTIHCPVCGKEIDHLHMYEQYEHQSDFYIDYIDERNVNLREEAPVDFECSECSALLFHDRDQVVKFLQWGDLYPWKGVDDYGQKDNDKDQDESAEAQSRGTGDGGAGVLEQRPGMQAGKVAA